MSDRTGRDDPPPGLRVAPPAAPGPGAREWRCRCGNLLGILDGDWLFARHRGRAITARLPTRVQCEDCGRRQTRLPQQAGPPDGASEAVA